MRRWKADISNVGEKCALYGLEGSRRMGYERSQRRMLQQRKTIRSGLQAAGSIGIVTGKGIKSLQQICVPRWKDKGRTFGQYLVLDVQTKAFRDNILHLLRLLRRLRRLTVFRLLLLLLLFVSHPSLIPSRRPPRRLLLHYSLP